MTQQSRFEQMWRNTFPNEQFPDFNTPLNGRMNDEILEKIESLAQSEPKALDGKFYYMEKRFQSLFTWGRPPLAADLLASVTDEHKIKSALVLGSCCPSILASIGFGDSERVIRVFDMQCRWDAGYQFFLEDSGDDSKYPQQNNWLPNNNILHPQEYSWSPRLGEMVFVDQPWKNPSPPRDIGFNIILRAIKPKMILMGFSGELPGPNDLEKLLIDTNWFIKEYKFEQVNTETKEINKYRMLVCLPPEI